MLNCYIDEVNSFGPVRQINKNLFPEYYFQSGFIFLTPNLNYGRFGREGDPITRWPSTGIRWESGW
jgi:hypothetical protein